MCRSLYCIFVFVFMLSCGNGEKNEAGEKVMSQNIGKSVPQKTTISEDKYYTVETAYVKYKNIAAGQEMTREWMFDQFGKRQYEDNYMVFMGDKTGDKTLIIDGYQYKWNYDSSEGAKRKYYMAVTDYNKVSERDIQRYGIKKEGFEDILGKKCLKVTVEKPVKSTVWTWNNIPLKTEAVFAGQQVVMEAVEIKTEGVDKQLFELPKDITFVDAK